MFLEDYVRPASDRVIKAVSTGLVAESERKRIESWRVTLSDILDRGGVESFAKIPEGKRITKRRSA